MTAPRPRARRGTRFPLVEVFGYPWDSEAPTAKSDWARQWCPFADRECEKFIQYGYGYCSVTYAAEWDEEWQTYAVCDHRLDGEPLRAVMLDHFKTIEGVHLVPEVTMRSSPKLNVDYVAFREDPSFADGVDLIAIETQAIDLRGGGVGPAFMAWREGNQREWRQYFTDEARAKGRRDSVDYGVNTGNVYKRLGTQVADKGVQFAAMQLPLYVVTQDRIFEQLVRRVPFKELPPEDASGFTASISFMTFEYAADLDAAGRYQLVQRRVSRTDYAAYVDALRRSTEIDEQLRSDFVQAVKRKHQRLQRRT